MNWEIYDLELFEAQQKSMNEIYDKYIFSLQQKQYQSLIGPKPPKPKEKPFITVYKSKEIRGVILELVTFNPKYVCSEV